MQKKKKIGRPTEDPKTTSVSVRFNEIEGEELQLASVEDDIPKAEIIRIATREYLAKRKKQRNN